MFFSFFIYCFFCCYHVAFVKRFPKMASKRKRKEEEKSSKKAKFIDVDTITTIIANGGKLSAKDIKKLKLALKDPQLAEILSIPSNRKKLCKFLDVKISQKEKSLKEMIRFTKKHGYENQHYFFLENKFEFLEDVRPIYLRIGETGFDHVVIPDIAFSGLNIDPEEYGMKAIPHRQEWELVGDSEGIKNAIRLLQALNENYYIQDYIKLRHSDEPIADKTLWDRNSWHVGDVIFNAEKYLSFDRIPGALERLCLAEKDIQQALQMKAQCVNSMDYFTNDDISEKEFLKLGHIIILGEKENDFTGTCYHRKELIKYLSLEDEDKPAIYGPYPQKENQYFKLPYPGTWIDEQAMRTLKKRNKVFKLRKIKEERIGSGFGISQLHGQEPLPIYTLDIVKKA